MEINILGRHVSMEMLIMIGILYIIWVLHTVCPCMNMPLMYESFVSATTPATKKVPTTAGTAGKKEGFASGYGAYDLNNASPYKMGDMSVPDTSKWMGPNLVVRPGQMPSKDVQEILNRPAQPTPLPEGEMLIFANNQWSPDACPNTYSTSTGCVMATDKQINYLLTRGGNNVPYSEY